MAEKEYETWIAKAKAELESYSAEQEAIKKLYEQARQNAQASYDAQKEQLAKQSAESKNQAAADMMQTERNIDQTLAARGLAFSGENAQTHLDLTLGLRNRLADIDSDTKAQTNDLEREKAQKLTELDLEYAKQRESSAEKKAQLNAELAGLAAEKNTAESGTSSDKSLSNKVNELLGKEETEGESIPFPNLKGKSLWQKLKLAMQYAAQKQADGGSADTGVTPDISARDLAKQLVASAGEEGTVTGYEQQEMLKILLEALTEEHDLEESYYRELLLNLQSMGYRPNYADDIASGTTEIQEQSVELYTAYYDRFYKLYELSGHKASECDRLAGEDARFKQLLYIYNNSESIERFEAAVRGLDLQGELEDFYKTVNESPSQYVLGSGLRR